MSRVITSSEVDTLHKQVAELQRRQTDIEVFLKSAFEMPPAASELFEADLSEVGSVLSPVADDTRSSGDKIVDEVAGD